MALFYSLPWNCYFLLGLILPINRATQTFIRSDVDSGAQKTVAINSRGSSFSHAEPARSPRPPFAQALILTIHPERTTSLQQALTDVGLSSELVMGFNAGAGSDLADARTLLKTLGYTDSVHWTFSVPFACMHMSPNTAPDWTTAAQELWSHLGSVRQNFDDMLATDSHRCVAKVASIAASHARMWRDLAEHRLPKTTSSGSKDDDAWFLILEDDVEFCPQWLQRLEKEIKEAPADADMLKLSYFGHWRQEDSPSGNSSSPFLEARNVMAADVGLNCFRDVVAGKGWASMPCTGFYAGNQAYLLRRRGAQKILDGMRGRPFQDIDVTIMDLVKTYVWRRVLAFEGSRDDSRQVGEKASETPAFLQVSAVQQAAHRERMLPVCNQDPVETGI